LLVSLGELVAASQELQAFGLYRNRFHIQGGQGL
jgi:hypothetical protein